MDGGPKFKPPKGQYRAPLQASKLPSFHVSKAPGLQASRGPKLLQPPSFSSFQAPKQPQAFKPAADSSLQAFHRAKPPSFSSFSSFRLFRAPCKAAAQGRTSTSFSKMCNFYLLLLEGLGPANSGGVQVKALNFLLLYVATLSPQLH